MDITAAAQEHRRLVSQRAEKAAAAVTGGSTPAEITALLRPLDCRIGHLAQALNPRIAPKARRWIARGI